MVDRIPGYQIIRELGRGGAATVYLAVQESLDRQVALKVIPGVGAGPEDLTERFRREARTAAGLRHQNIIDVYDIGSHQGALYLSMEYLRGEDLDARLRRGLPLRTCLGIVKDVAAALQHAHENRIVHRDVKPQNIMFREDGSTVLTDFGIAKVAGVNELTQTGTVYGTPHYMSPEQLTGSDVDGRSDLYSLGVVLFRMLAGRRPFEGESIFDVAVKHLNDPVPRLPPGLEGFQPIVNRLMAKQPGDRFQTAAELIASLAAVPTEGVTRPPFPAAVAPPAPAPTVPPSPPETTLSGAPSPLETTLTGRTVAVPAGAGSARPAGPPRAAPVGPLPPFGLLGWLRALFRRLEAWLRVDQGRTPAPVPTSEAVPAPEAAGPGAHHAAPAADAPTGPSAAAGTPPDGPSASEDPPEPLAARVGGQPAPEPIRFPPLPPRLERATDHEHTQLFSPGDWAPAPSASVAGPDPAASLDHTRLVRVPDPARPGADLPVALGLLSSTDPRRVGTRIRCERFPFVIGRAEGADLSFPNDVALSRQHVEIDVDADGFVLRDSSSNGVYLNGRHLRGRSEPLMFGSTIVLSPTTSLTFVADLPALPDLSGRELADRYLLEERIHGSIKAVTYLARDLRLPRKLAVKVFEPGLLRLGHYRGEFVRLAELAAQLQHPHIVKVLDFGESPPPSGLGAERLPFLCTEYMVGGSLARRLEKEALPPLDAVLGWTQRLAEALDHAHRNGVIHGDLKPARVVFDRDDRPYLTDFCFASRRDQASVSTALGTPAYLAPERWEGASPTEASDQYSLAALTYLLLTGTRPFEGQAEPEVRRRNFLRGPFPAHDEALRAGREDVPRSITDVLARGLGVDPGERFGSVLEFSRAFSGALAGPRGRDRRARVFLSYQREASSGWAHHFRDKLEGQHALSVFVDTLAKDGAPRIPDRLREEIERCDVFVCLLAPSTLSSDWVRQEIRIAVEKGKPMVPVFHEEFKITDDRIAGDPNVEALLAYDAVHLLDRRNIHVEHTITELAERIRKVV